jgi:hypothetical protein
VIPAAAADRTAPAVRLIYERAEDTGDCPDTNDVMNAVRGRLGYDPFREPAELTVVARVERRGDELHATIRMSDRETLQADRQLTSPRADCSELASAMLLAISIAIDPLSVPPEPAPPAVAGAPPAPTVVVSTPPAAAPTPRSSTSVELALGAAGNTGVSVAPALGFFAGAAVAHEGWSVMLEGRADLPRSRPVAGGSIDASTLAATLVPCLRRGWFGACALGGVAALRGAGHDLADARQVTTTYLTLGARAQAEILRRGPLAVRAHLDLVSPLARTTVKVGGEPVWTTPPLGAALGLGIVVRFR